MEEKSKGVLQTSRDDLTLVISKAPICTPIVEKVSSGKTYQELVQSSKGISGSHTKVFQDGVVVEDWSQTPSNGVVAIVQMPSGFSAIVVAAVVSAVVGAVVGYLMYESPEPVSEGEKQRRVRGDRNQNKGYEALPYILGRRKVVPAYAANPYSEWVGQQQYYYMLLHIGYGPLKVENIKIGDVDISSFDDDTEVAWVDWFENTDVSKLKDIWSKSVSQNLINAELPRINNFLSNSVPNGLGTVKLVYDYPQGLRWQAGRGPAWTSSSVQFQYQGSDGTWYTPCRYSNYQGGDTFAPYNRLIKGADEYGWIIAGNVHPRDYFRNIGRSVTTGSFPIHTTSFEIDPDIVTSIPSSDVVYDDGKGFAIVRGNYRLASNSVSANTGSDFTTNFEFPLNLAGNVDQSSPVPFRARNLQPLNTTSKPLLDRVDLLTITRSSEVSDEEFGRTIALPSGSDNENVRQAVLALKIRASEQLTGTVNDLNVIASSVVPSDMSTDWRDWWTDTSVRNSLTLSDNPAKLYKWVLQGPMNSARVANNKIDLDTMSDWEASCISEGWRTSALMNEPTTLKETLNNIAKTGRAQFSMRNGVFSVVENVERTLPSQIFTPKNSRDFSSKREFPSPSDGITIEFQNEDEDFEVDEWTYFDPTIPLANRIGQTDSMEMWGIADPVLAQKHARFAYFEKKLRRETYTLTTDIEGLVCERGSLVRVANDVVDIGLGQGFIKSVDGLSFTVDETVGLISGNTYGVTVRSVSSGVDIQTISAQYVGDGEWLASTLPQAGLNSGDLVSYGELGKESLDCIVQEISYNNDYEATLTLTNAANIIYTYDGDTLPPYETALTPKPEKFKPEVPSLLVSLGQSSYDNPTLKVQVSNSGRLANNVSMYKLQYRVGDEYWIPFLEDDEEPPEDYEINPLDGSVWIDAGFSPASDGVFFVPIQENIGAKYYFRAKAYGEGNLTSDWSEEVTSTVSDSPAPDVVDFTVTESVNHPKTPDGMYSTLTVEVDEPSGAPYLYSVVEYRTPSNDPFDPENPWFEISKVGWKFSSEAEVQVLANGTQYEFRVRSVSTWGVPNKNGLRKVITTTNTQSPEYTDENPFDALPVPNVRGLELFEQGNDTEFGGKDAKFVWRKSTVGDWVDLGYEGLRGAGASRLDQYFRDYQVEVWADNKPIRTEFVVDNLYVYTFEKNAEDFKRETGQVGAYREFELRVVERGRNNQVSERIASLSVSNTAPQALQGLTILPGFNVIEISYTRPVDLDFAGVDIWVSTVSGFDPDTTEPTITTSDNNVVASGLDQNTTYYVRLRPFDDFGKTGTNTTSEFVVKTKSGVDLTGLSGWAYQIDDVDRAFIEANLADDAVPSEKIVNITAAKVTTGTLNATETITSEGLIRAVDDANTPSVQTGIGPTTFGTATTYLMWAYNGQDVVFGVDELGNVEMTGKLSIAAGSAGVSNFSDAGALATQDSADWQTQVLGSGKPEDNATVGADWTGNVANKPLTFRVISKGGSATSNPELQGLYAEDGTLITRATRSYRVSVLDRATQTWDSHTNYDVYSSTTNAANMAAQLNSLGADKIVVVHTNDEPNTNRLASGLPEAMYRCGASPSVFGAASFKHRSAYILVGIPVIGQGNGVEFYAGDVNSSSDAWVETLFTVNQGNLALSGYRSSSALDISYADGITIEDLKPAQAGADVTGNNTAANIVNQGTLATLSSVGNNEVTFNYATSSSKGGNASDTDNVNGQSSSTVKNNANAGATFTSSNAGSLAYKSQADSSDVSFNYAGSGTKGGSASNTTKVGTKSASVVVDGVDRAITGLDTNGVVTQVIQGSKLPTGVSTLAGGELLATNQYLGWHNGNGALSGWQTYLKSDGQFHFGDNTANFIDYNGTTLAIKTNNIIIDTGQFSLDLAGNATFSGQLSAASGLINGSLRSGSVDGNGDFTGFYAEGGNVGYVLGGDLVTAGGGNSESWNINSSGLFSFSTSAFGVPSNASLDWAVGGVGSAASNEPNLKLKDAALVLTSSTNDMRMSFFNGLFQINRSFRVDGSFTATGNVTAYSDVRLKTDIEVIPEALNKVRKLGGYYYNRSDIPDSGRQVGVLAQELLEVLPEAVEGGPTEDNPDALYSVAQGNLVGLLIEAVKELSDKVSRLEMEVNKK